jgi:hypothetical protein
MRTISRAVDSFAEVAAGGLRRRAGGISKLSRGQRAPAEQLDQDIRAMDPITT